MARLCAVFVLAGLLALPSVSQAQTDCSVVSQNNLVRTLMRAA